jgi:hypothetical protein
LLVFIRKIGYRDPNDPNMLEIPEILKIAEEAGRTPAQVILAWAVQRGGFAIPKSLTPKRILSNFAVQDDFLTKDHMNTLNSLDQGYRYVRVPYYDFPDDTVDLSLTQPKAVEGTVQIIQDTEVYHNRFYRPGKPLDSRIVIEKGAISNLATRAGDYIPEKCHNAKCYLVTDAIGMSCSLSIFQHFLHNFSFLTQSPHFDCS